MFQRQLFKIMCPISKDNEKLKVFFDKLQCIWQYARFVVLPFLLYVIEESFYKICNIDSKKPPIIMSHIIGFIVVLAMYYLFFGIFKNFYKTTIIMSIILSILMLVNQIKILYSSNPVFIGDIRFLSTPGTFTDILKENFGGILLAVLPPFVVMILAFVGVCYIAKKQKYEISSRYKRASISLVSFMIIFILIGPVTPINNFIIDNFFSIDEKKNDNTVSNVKYYYQHSFFAGMVGEYLNTKLREPEGYSKEEIEEIMSSADDVSKEYGKPNIIMVFSESFFDLSVIDEVKFDKEITKNFNELASKGMKFDMISPNFGGISCNPEFEMTTGGSLKFFPNNYIAFMNLYTTDMYKGKTSVYKELKNNGYYTKIANCWSKNLFNVENVYNYFEVDEVEYLVKTDENKKGGRISDDYLAEKIINEFNNKDDSPMFYLALTAENHMPYKETKYDKYDIDVTSSSLNEEETKMLKSYAQGVYDADLQLKKLYDFICDFDEPTILIFYGDHLPFLKTDSGQDLYEHLSYFNTDDELLNTYRLYNTECIILDNFNAKYDDISYMGPDLVMSYIMNHMDIELSDYYRWLYTTIDVLPASNKYVSVDKDGNIYNTNELPCEMNEMFKLREKANWYSFVDIYDK